MAIYTYNILSYGIEQGSISGTQETESDTRVRSTGFIPLDSSPKTATVTALSNTSKICCANFVGYSSNDLTSVICDLYWYDSPYTFDLSGYSGINYCKIVFKYTDNSNITPNEIATATLAIDDWKWTVEDGKLTYNGLPEPLEYIMTEPYPPFWWSVSNGRLVHTGLPAPEIRGAFAHCKNLDTAHIPESCKQLGTHTFRNTALESVTIADDCTYSTTTFPEDCEINYYEDGGEGE